ncbi:helix-turn-helix domain-containing protein [Humibacillus xanthopallidus]|uniref:Sugar-specific transcriptional regulator TrmB n=1 Tax=Humibacillus xanthopallidus TaxID=412689 RepID=A0A543I1Q8_9MICO|nr:helix-turn-helix domain-containing protein [Humibacillus xanthopallidus]TQM64522.1 sugar-specific transcriptional regulator TrmB [Humibacillus xanthopallidus]
MEVLGALGFSPEEATVYRTLVGLGATELADLARRCTMPDGDVEQAVLALRARGLVAESAVAAGRWVAAPPGVALRAIVNDRRHELEQAELAAARLAEAHRTEASVDVHDLVEVVIGAGAVGQRFHQLQLGAVSEVCAFVTDRPSVVRADENAAEDVATARGVRYRVVLERDVLEHEPQANVAAVLRREEEVRVVERVPTKLVVADGRTALVPLDVEGAEPSALVIHAAGLVASLMALFESVWREAWPLVLATPDADEVVELAAGPDEFDLQVLSLLLAGASDARVARQLDVGLRTVQRRVRSLMDATGSTTRIQLGWAAHERGWVARADASGGPPVAAVSTAMSASTSAS